jgi:hypothetical protein
MAVVLSFVSSRVCLGIAVLALLAGCQTAPVQPPPDPPVVAPADVATPTPPPKPPRIGLALGGGAARGFAHIGVIQVLEETASGPTWSSARRPAAWSPRCTPRARTARRSASWPIRWTKPRSPTGRFPAAD